MTDKPRCPKHPESPVCTARKVGENTRQWICLTCGAKLGDAGPSNHLEKETVTIEKKDIGEL